jgi:hypothetical protein
MLGGGVDDHMRAQLQRLLEQRRREHVVDHDAGADLVGELGNAGNVDHFERRVGRAFQEEHLGIRLDRLFPVLQMATIDQRAFDAVARRQRLDHPAAGAEQGARGDDMIAGLQLAKKCRGDRRHAGCGGAGLLGTFERAHALFEHVVGGAAIAGIDIAVVLALEARLGSFRTVVGKALRQVDRFRHLAILRAQGAAVHERGGRAPVLIGGLAHLIITFVIQKNRPHMQTGFQPDLFSHLFNVAASRPAKSPRDKAAILPIAACVNSSSLVLSARITIGTRWLAILESWRTAPLLRCSKRGVSSPSVRSITTRSSRRALI